LRKPDGAAFSGSRAALAVCSIKAMSSHLGFWSLDPATGTLTCCPAAAATLGVTGSSSCMLRDLLFRLIPVDRRRLLRAGLASTQRRSGFDIVVLMRFPGGPRLLRVIGGLGYEPGQRDPRVHGLVERVALADRDA
jgi:hypothetical protein